MRIIITNIFIVLILMPSCVKQKDDRKDSLIDTVQTKMTPDEPKKEKIIENFEDFNQFENIYKFDENDLKQKLGINWITADSVEFSLRTQEGFCDTYCNGVATKIFANSEDKHSTEEFVLEGDEYKVSIKVSTDSDTVRFIFKTKSEENSCMPISNQLVREKNER